MLKFFRKTLVFSIIALTLQQFSSCTLLKERRSYAPCELRLSSVENIRLSGVNVQNVNNVTGLSSKNAVRLIHSVSLNRFPLELTLNIETRNPNRRRATLSRLDWILFIDDIKMLEGTTHKHVSIPQNGGIASFPINFTINLKEVLKSKPADALINFGLNLSDANNKPVRFTLRAKPYVNINNVQIPYTDYLDIKTDFVSD